MFCFILQGTGKTRTLVAATIEIIKSSNNNVLICANSYSACDEITGRLLPFFKPSEIFRMYAKSYNEKNVTSEILNCSNFIGGQTRFPCLKHLYGYRIVICTLLTAGCITRARNDPNFDPGHFSHIIIDESASTNEATTLIAIAGIRNSICISHFSF